MARRKKQKPKVNPDLEGFEMQIDSLGEIKSSFEIDKINTFLNREVEDKKLVDRKDFKSLKKDKDDKNKTS